MINCRYKSISQLYACVAAIIVYLQDRFVEYFSFLFQFCSVMHGNPSAACPATLAGMRTHFPMTQCGKCRKCVARILLHTRMCECVCVWESKHFPSTISHITTHTGAEEQHILQPAKDWHAADKCQPRLHIDIDGSNWGRVSGERGVGSGGCTLRKLCTSSVRVEIVAEINTLRSWC